MKNDFARRKRSLLDREVQIGLAGVILGYLVIYTCFLLLLLGLPIWFIYQYAPGSDAERMAAIGSFLVDDQRFWILIAIFILAIAMHSIFITRKFAGPIFVFRRHLRRAQNGELARIYLRKGDGFQDIKDLLNDHFDQLSDTMVRIRSGLDALEERLDQIKRTGVSEIEAENSSAALSDIREEVGKLQSLSKKTWSYSG